MRTSVAAAALAFLLTTGWSVAAEIETRTESFTSGGVRIGVEWFEAAGSASAERRPAVLMLHGADGRNFVERYRVGARSLAEDGYHVFLLHYFDRTGDRWASLTTIFRNFLTWMSTLDDALTWVGRHPGVDPRRIGVLGVSLGASLSMAAAAQDARIKALVVYFGPVPDGAAEGITRMPPTLILHGAADPIVPVSNAYALEELLKKRGTPYEIAVYPGQGHGFRGQAQADAVRRVTAFLDRYLRGGTSRAGEE